MSFLRKIRLLLATLILRRRMRKTKNQIAKVMKMAKETAKKKTGSTTDAQPGGGGAFDSPAAVQSLAGEDLAQFVAEGQQELEAEANDPENVSENTGKKLKPAREAQQTLDFQQILGAGMGPVNRLFGKYVPELEFTEDEKEVVSKLGGRVLARRMDLGEVRPEEAVLGIVLGAKLLDAAPALVKRAQKLQQRAPGGGQRAEPPEGEEAVDARAPAGDGMARSAAPAPAPSAEPVDAR